MSTRWRGAHASTTAAQGLLGRQLGQDPRETSYPPWQPVYGKYPNAPSTHTRTLAGQNIRESVMLKRTLAQCAGSIAIAELPLFLGRISAAMRSIGEFTALRKLLVSLRSDHFAKKNCCCTLFAAYLTVRLPGNME